MKKNIWALLAGLYFPVLIGQISNYKSYKFSQSILQQLSKDSSYYEAAQDLSYIGEYEKMLGIWDMDEQRPPSGLTPKQAKHFSGFRAINARDYILEKAKTEQIIIINEAHQQPYHRVFTTSLLRDLSKAGFRYFGAETISNYDICLKELEKKRYPTLKSGFYTCEPYYGNLLREAIQEGFEVFAYETTRIGNTDSGGINLREIDQAKNIKKILDKNPGAKIIIHCGWDHIVETPYASWGKAMAGRLYELTGINPFTIDQTKLTEHSTTEFQNPYWSMVQLQNYAMFVDSTGEPFYGPPEAKNYDARVYHPKTIWQNGRPHWVFENNRIPYFLKKKIHLTYPCLVFAFISKEWEESENAIPFDIFELNSASEVKALSLKKNTKFTIIVRDIHSAEQRFNIKVD